MLQTVIEKTKAFLGQPFRADMDAAGWFLFFGLLLVIAFAWGLILRHLKDIG